MNKKICHMTSAHNRYDIRIFVKECVSLAKNGLDVTLIVNDIAPDELIEGVKIVSTKLKPQNRLQRFIYSKKHLYKKALEVNADIYHIHDPDLLTIARRLTKKGKKVIYDSHEDVPRQILSKNWIPKNIRSLISYTFEKYENKTTKILAAVVVPTPHIADRFRQINNDVYMVCNFPLLSEFEVSTTNSLKRNNACYVGGISINRGIRQIVEATQKAKLDLILCGKFESEELKNEIVTSFQHVKYLGFLNRKGIAKVLNESIVGIVTLLPTPNHVNSYPIKMFEYMAAGMPIIASNIPLWEEIIQKHNCGICVDPRSVEEIEKAIKHITKNPEAAKVMGRNGEKAVLEEYNWESQVKILISMYNKLIR